MTSETSSETSSEVGASPTSEEKWVNPFPVPREPGHQVPRTFERQEAGTHVQIKLANEEFGQRMDVQEMMMKVMQATICSCPEDPLQFITDYLERELTGEGNEAIKNGFVDPNETNVHDYAGNVKFQIVLHRLSSALIEFKPEGDPLSFAVEYLKKLKEDPEPRR
jgi:hypothetical protein